MNTNNKTINNLLPLGEIREGSLTKNFSLSEFTRSATAKARGIDNTPGVSDIRNLQALCSTILQPIRDKWTTSPVPASPPAPLPRGEGSHLGEIGRPEGVSPAIIVSSGYRCPALNKAIGGATNSDHMYGCAADIAPQPPAFVGRQNAGECWSSAQKKLAVKALFDLIVSMIKSGEIVVKQLIDEKNYQWIHISYQDGRTGKRNQILHIK